MASDQSHFISKNLGMALSKGSLHVLNDGQAITHGLKGAFANMDKFFTGSAGGAAAVGGIGGLAAMGAVGAISAAMAQMDYRHDIAKMKELYRHEIAAKLGKAAKSVTDKDLFLLARGDAKRGIEGNNILEEELGKKRSERTLGVLLSAGATMTSFAVVSAAKVALEGAAQVISTSLGLPGAGTAIVTMVLDVAVGVGIYNAVKQPLHWIGHKIFGLDKETTHDRIAEIQKELSHGKGISQEQVLGVFVSANTQLQQFIKDEYGMDFNKLSQHERYQVANDIGKMVPLAEMTANINTGKYDVGELAFAVEGKSSGYLPHLERKPQSWLDNMASKLRGMFHYKPAPKPEQAETPAAAPVEAAHPKHAWHPADERVGKDSFVHRHASGRHNAARGYVERLEQAHSEGPGSQQLV